MRRFSPRFPPRVGETTYDSMPSLNSQAVGLDPRGEELLFGNTWEAEKLPPLISKDLHTGAFNPVFNLQCTRRPRFAHPRPDW